MTPKQFPQTKQTKGLPLTAVTLTACVTSLITIVACLEGGTVTEVLPNSTQQHIIDESPQNLINNNTLHTFKSHYRSSIELASGMDSKNDSEVEYFEVPRVFHNMSTVPEERIGRAKDLAGDTTTQTVNPGEDTNSMEWLQNVYNPHLWGSSPPGELGPICGEDMRIYLAALNNGSLWAAKSKYAHCIRHSTFLVRE
jgi:hypothetical protein